MLDFEIDSIQMTNCFLKWTVMLRGFCNLFLILEQKLEQRFLLFSQLFTLVSS